MAGHVERPVCVAKSPWIQDLTDAGQFSYAAICALSLLELYGSTPTDRNFQEHCLKTIVKQLDLAKSTQVSTSIKALMHGQGSEDKSAFIELFKMDDVVQRIGLQQVPEDLVTLAIRDGCYDARMRVLIRHISEMLELNWQEVEDFERSLIAKIKTGQEHEMSEEEKKEKESRALKRKVKRYTLIGLATVGGGALLGLTGGLAAPLLAAGAGAIVGGAGAAALGSVAGVAIIGSLFGVAGAGLSGYKMQKRVGEVEEFEFEILSEEGDLHVTIAITGWITDDEPDFRSPWANLVHSRDQYSLRYESDYLKTMGMAMDYLLSIAVSTATQETLKYTVLSGLLAAVAWPAALLSASSLIDNPWSVCTQRTAAAGRHLAEVLLARQQGKRPVTLVGFSLGARVVFYCLAEMARRKNCEGVVQDAIMLGAPVSGSAKHWLPLTRVVAGRIVNGYCKSDWLLRFLYRTASIQFSIAGLQEVALADRRMVNIDLSNVVKGHLDYWNKIDLILSLAGIHTTIDDLVCTAAEASDVTPTGESSIDQWMVIESKTKEPRGPDGGTATHLGPPICHLPSAQTQGSISTDSGFGREDNSEMESLVSAAEGLTLDTVSEGKKSPSHSGIV